MTTDQTKNIIIVQIRARDLAEAALLRHWMMGDDYHKERYAKAEAQLLAAVFADLPGLISRIEDAMLAVHDADVDFRDYATAVSCDLVGKSFDEALRERREAEDAA